MFLKKELINDSFNDMFNVFKKHNNIIILFEKFKTINFDYTKHIIIDQNNCDFLYYIPKNNKHNNMLLLALKPESITISPFNYVKLIKPRIITNDWQIIFDKIIEINWEKENILYHTLCWKSQEYVSELLDNITSGIISQTPQHWISK